MKPVPECGFSKHNAMNVLDACFIIDQKRAFSRYRKNEKNRKIEVNAAAVMLGKTPGVSTGISFLWCQGTFHI